MNKSLENPVVLESSIVMERTILSNDDDIRIFGDFALVRAEKLQILLTKKQGSDTRLEIIYFQKQNNRHCTNSLTSLRPV
jgi:hypothetical protein